MVEHPPSMRLNRAGLDRLAEQVQRGFTLAAVDLGTQMEHGRLFNSNALANLEVWAAAHPVAPLAGAYRGVPGFCVAAGPSLSKNLHLLAGVAGQCVIAAVDTALAPLARAGVLPDVVASIDPHPQALGFTTGVPGLARVALLFDQEVCPAVPAAFPGPRLACDIHSNLPRWTQALLGSKGSIPKGMTVSQTAFFLLRFLGCDPIVFLGLDLGFPGRTTHAAGTVRAWGGTVERFRAEEGRQMRTVGDIFGRPIPTLSNFLSFLTRFESEVAATAAVCVDATEGGALIRGTRVLKLREVLDRWCRGRSPKPPLASLLGEAPAGNGAHRRRVAEGLAALEASLVALADRGGGVLEALAALPARPEELVRLQQAMQAFLAHDEALRVIEYDMARSYLEFMAGQGSLESLVSTLPGALAGAERVRGFVEGARTAAGAMAAQIRQRIEGLG